MLSSKDDLFIASTFYREVNVTSLGFREMLANRLVILLLPLSTQDIPNASKISIMYHNHFYIGLMFYSKTHKEILLEK